MVYFTDYVGLRFAPFVIEAHIAGGGEAEVYRVRHEGTGRSFALRLPVDDPKLWGNEPLCPPVNAELERRTAWNTFLVHDSGRHFGPYVYAVLDGRYLIAVSAPYRVKASLDIDAILKGTPPGYFSTSTFAEEIVFGTFAALLGLQKNRRTKLKTELEWVAGDPLVSRRVRELLQTAPPAISHDKVSHATRRLSLFKAPPHRLEDNPLMRLCVLAWEGIIPDEAAAATILCEHFRNNVTAADIAQFHSCCDIQANYVVNGTGARFRLPILRGLDRQPIRLPENRVPFPEALIQLAGDRTAERSDSSADLEDFALALPEWAEGLESSVVFDRLYPADRFDLFFQELVAEQSFLTLRWRPSKKNGPAAPAEDQPLERGR